MTAAAAAAASPAPRTVGQGRGTLGFDGRRRLFLAAMAAPALLYVVLIAVWPLLQGIVYSFYDYNLIRPRRTALVGLDNYRALAADVAARRAILNTFVFTFLTVGVELVLGLALALLLWRDDRFNRIVLAFILIPVSITPLAVGLVFKGLLAVEFGQIGYWARAAGLVGEHGFFGDPGTAFATIVAIDVWQWTPLVALILLAGLKALPQELIEAAETDGATAWQKMRHVIVPLLLPAIYFTLLLRTMDAFRLFDSVFVTTKGGPGDATNVLMFYAVKVGLEFFNIGYASALANLMLVCMAALAAVFTLLMRDGRRPGRWR